MVKNRSLVRPIAIASLVVMLVVRGGAGGADDSKPVKDATEQRVTEKTVRAMDRKDVVNPEAALIPLRALLSGVVVRRAPVAGGRGQAAQIAQQNEAMVQQFLPQMRSLLNIELGLVRQVFPELPPDQRQKVYQASAVCLRPAAEAAAGMRNRSAENTDPRIVIRRAIAAAVDQALQPEQTTRFQEEMAKRNTARKHAAVISVVARLDDQLFLTQSQREKITEAFTARWQDGWEKWLMVSQSHGGQYFPMVPDQCVTPFLTAPQKSVWLAITKQDFGWWGNEAIHDLEHDQWWGIEPPKDAEGAVGQNANAQAVGFD